MDANTGDTVRVANRRGVSLVGQLVDRWAVGSGAVCVKVRPAAGGPPKVYAVDAVEVLAHAACSGPVPTEPRLRPGPVRRAAG